MEVTAVLTGNYFDGNNLPGQLPLARYDYFFCKFQLTNEIIIRQQNETKAPSFRTGTDRADYRMPSVRLA